MCPGRLKGAIRSRSVFRLREHGFGTSTLLRYLKLCHRTSLHKATGARGNARPDASMMSIRQWRRAEVSPGCDLSHSRQTNGFRNQQSSWNASGEPNGPAWVLAVPSLALDRSAAPPTGPHRCARRYACPSSSFLRLNLHPADLVPARYTMIRTAEVWRRDAAGC